MPRAQENKKKEPTRQERRARRLLRREKQRKDNIGRAAKMHAARLQMERADHGKSAPGLKASAYVGCSGWFYWKWRGLFYPDDLPTREWFRHYAKCFDTVEINASFYSWPTVANVKAWGRQAGKRSFVYTIKVCELITHIKRFRGTKILIKDFGMIADILGDRMGCFLFQLPPSHRYTKARLISILGQLDPTRRNVVEFRHASWWNETVYAAFRQTGTIFCSCSGPRLRDELVRTADDVYLRLHGPERWYRHNYSKDELSKWADRITASGAKRAWVYFNNDYEAHAPRNAATMRRLLVESPSDVPREIGADQSPRGESESVIEMSRAFVREQDIEALEELPDRLISPHPNDVTDEGMKQLELMLKAAREAHAAALRGQDRSALTVAARDLRYWSARRATARVIPSPTDTTEVRFGSSVSIRRSDGREQTFRIVGEDEANPSQGTISHASPLARALMGKGLGDVARLGTTEVEILAIR